MTEANAYTVKRIDKDTYELWYENEYITALTREQAWPVMIGQVHPSSVVQENTNHYSQELSKKE